MSWEALKPVARTSGRSMVTARLTALKGDRVTLALFLSDFIVQAMGECPAVLVDIGAGEEAGRMRLRFAGDGDFAVKRSAKAWRVTLPGEAFGSRSSETLACTVVDQDAVTRTLVIQLPVDDWARTPAPPPVKAGPSAVDGGGRTQGGATLTPSPSNPLNAAEYLRAKGHKVDVLAGNRLQVDGDPLAPGAVLSLINKHRDKAGLMPLSRAEIEIG